jgi:hypothetical protein
MLPAVTRSRRSAAELHAAIVSRNADAEPAFWGALALSISGPIRARSCEPRPTSRPWTGPLVCSGGGFVVVDASRVGFRIGRGCLV